MAQVFYITHPEVIQDPAVPVPDWGLSPVGFDRARAFAQLGVCAAVRSVWCSAEQKARDGARVIADHLGLTAQVLETLGENDRSATGYLPQAEFEAMVEDFFGAPDASARGWETARAAQARCVAAMRKVCDDSAPGDIVVVGHGGVGNLLNCHVRGLPISRACAAKGMGSWFAFSRDGWELTTNWMTPPDVAEREGETL